MASSRGSGTFRRIVRTGIAIFTITFGVLSFHIVVLAFATINARVGTLRGRRVVRAFATGSAPNTTGSDAVAGRGRPSSRDAIFAGRCGTLLGLVTVFTGNA